MQAILLLFIVLLLTFLITVAAIYIARPVFFLETFLEGGGPIVDVDMWKAFIVGLLVAMAAVAFVGFFLSRGCVCTGDDAAGQHFSDDVYNISGTHNKLNSH